MLSENDDVISFCPGFIQNGHITLGRIVVHDRIKVETEILPRYFNHSSFASLRRQLNYFSFTRIGKGRQKGATYYNDGVVVIEDILRLRRRSSTVSSSGGVTGDVSSLVSAKNRHREHLNINTPITKAVSFLPTGPATNNASPRPTTKRALSVSSFHSCPKSQQQPIKKVRHGIFNHSSKGHESTLHIIAPLATPKLVSPVTSPLHSPSTSPSAALQVTLDLTVPPPQFPSTSTSTRTSDDMISSSNDSIHQTHQNRTTYLEDPDILAGCRALLCFSHGLHSLTA